LVRDLLEAESLAVLFGPPGSAKSFLALDLGASIATGADFHGRPIETHGLVAYVAGEGQGGLARRLRAWSIARGASLNEAPFLVSTEPAGLCLEASVAAVESAIAGAAKTHGSPVLLVFDTWSRNLAGDENSSLHSALGVAALDRLRKPWGAAVLVIHHEGWAQGRARGSTVLRAAADLELRVERGGDGLVRVAPTKVKDTGPPAPLAFALADVELGINDEEGRPVSSAVLREVQYRIEAGPRSLIGKNQRTALGILEDLAAEGLPVLATEWRNACGASGLDRRRFSEARASLLAEGVVREEGQFVVVSEDRPKRCPNRPNCPSGSPSSASELSGGPIRAPDTDGRGRGES